MFQEDYEVDQTSERDVAVDLVASIIEDITGVSPKELDEDTGFEELGLDSLDIVEAVCRVEDELGIELEDLDGVDTLGKFIDIVSGKE